MSNGIAAEPSGTEVFPGLITSIDSVANYILHPNRRSQSLQITFKLHSYRSSPARRWYVIVLDKEKQAKLTISPVPRPQAVRDLARFLHNHALTPSRPSPAYSLYVIFLDTCTSRYSHRLAHRPLIGSTWSCSILTHPGTHRLAHRPPKEST